MRDAVRQRATRHDASSGERRVATPRRRATVARASPKVAVGFAHRIRSGPLTTKAIAARRRRSYRRSSHGVFRHVADATTRVEHASARWVIAIALNEAHPRKSRSRPGVFFLAGGDDRSLKSLNREIASLRRRRAMPSICVAGISIGVASDES